MKIDIKKFDKYFSLLLLTVFVIYSIFFIFKIFENVSLLPFNQQKSAEIMGRIIFESIFVIITLLMAILFKRTLHNQNNGIRIKTYSILIGVFSTLNFLIADFEHGYMDNFLDLLLKGVIGINFIIFAVLIIYLLLTRNKDLSRLFMILLLSPLIFINIIKFIFIPSSFWIDFSVVIFQVILVVRFLKE